MSEILTYTGKMFDPLMPDPELIDIRDIAHALSMLCRANGHFPAFHSVGQHCLECAREAQARGYSRRVQLACLLHDGSEAYLSDVTRPVKKAMPLYLTFEEPLQEAIWNKWLGAPLTEEERRQVFAIDDEELYHEFFHFTGYRLGNREPELKIRPDFEFVSFRETEEAYLQCFRELVSE